jgi:hypothetical protein
LSSTVRSALVGVDPDVVVLEDVADDLDDAPVHGALEIPLNIPLAAGAPSAAVEVVVGR